MKNGRKTKLVVCNHCKKEFEKTLSEIKRSKIRGYGNYCSRHCGGRSREKISLKPCLECGKETKTKFCSQSCTAKFNNKKRKGTKYKLSEAGLISLRKSISKISRYSEIEYKEYYKSPNYCKECGEKLIFKHRKRVFCCIQCKRKYDSRNVTEYQKYYRACSFDFNLSDYPDEFNFELIKKYGWYSASNHGNNLNGVSRDHMVSIMFGYKNKIDPEIISHPANCQLMQHNNNSSKWKNCSLTLEELNKKIEEWNNKYK